MAESWVPNVSAIASLDAADTMMLERKVLPNAERRLPSIVSVQMQAEDTVQLKDHFQTQLQAIFTHYADAYDRRMRSLGRPASHKRMMGYHELLQFGIDTHLTMLPRLSRLEIGNIFLAVAPVPANAEGKRITIKAHSDFWGSRLGAVTSLRFHPTQLLLAAGASNDHLSVFAYDANSWTAIM